MCACFTVWFHVTRVVCGLSCFLEYNKDGESYLDSVSLSLLALSLRVELFSE